MRNNYSKRSKYRGHYRDRSSFSGGGISSDHYVPDARTRAMAQKNLDKYLGLARDASASGDRILAEHYYQHADHYYRIVHAGQPAVKQAQNATSASSASEDDATVIDVSVEPVELEVLDTKDQDHTASGTVS